ncbi:MAG: hypothetical protein OCD02_20890 [Spirochaetaceae bacterium]
MIFDEYYHLNLEIDIEEGWLFNRIKLTDENFEVLFNYDEVIVSPLIYAFYKKKWEQFKGIVHVLEADKQNIGKSHIKIFVNKNRSYQELVSQINNYDRISVIIENSSKYSNKDIDYLKKQLIEKNLIFLIITEQTNKKVIDNFISNNSETELWIIDSSELGFYTYEKIQDGKIVLADAGDLYRINSNIIFSFELDVSKEISKYITSQVDYVSYNLEAHF